MSGGRKEFLRLLYERVSGKYVHRRPSRFEIREALETLLTILEEALTKGEKVSISGFGTFQVKTLKPRKGRHFRTGEIKELPPRKRPVFKPSRRLLELLNS